MSTIDERVVAMRLNNTQFEAAAKTTLTTIGKLNTAFTFKGDTKGINDVSKSLSNMPLNAIQNSIDTIGSKFNTMSIVGITAIQRLTNNVINSAERMIKSLTIDPVKTGLSEYETKMNAITTIMTNTQSDFTDENVQLAAINATLAELNEYADQTIYNFAEMTKNIGTFTAAGIDLETSANAIKGIANLAAGTGATAAQASSAMYQMSQAMSAGSLKLIDYNSLVNAGMGGEAFKQAAIDIALMEGAIGEGQITMENFRNSLESGWLTAELLTKTFESFADNQTFVDAATEVKTFTQLMSVMAESVQSGWAVTWEAIIGDREEAIEMLTAINNAFSALIAPSTEARNAMLQFWNDAGGRDEVLDGIADIFNKILLPAIEAVSSAFEAIFPPKTGADLVELSIRFRNFARELELSEDTLDMITRAFKGLFAIFSIGIKVVKVIASGVIALLKAMNIDLTGILKATAAIGDFFVMLDQGFNLDTLSDDLVKMGAAFKQFGTNIIDGLIQGVTSGVKKIITAMRSIGESIINTFKETLDINSPSKVMTDAGEETVNGVVQGIKNKFTDVKNAVITLGTNIVDGFKSGFTKIYSTVTKGWDNTSDEMVDGVENTEEETTTAMEPFGSGITSYLKQIWTNISQMLNDMRMSLYDESGKFDFSKLVDLIMGSALIALAVNAAKLLNNISAMFKSFASIGTNISNTLVTVQDALKSFQASLKPTLLEQITRALLGLTGALFILSILPQDKIENALSIIVIALASLTTVFLLLMNSIKKLKPDELIAVSTILSSFTNFMLFFAIAVAALTAVGMDNVMSGLIALSAGFLVMYTAIKLFADIQKGLGKVKFDTIAKMMNDMIGIITKLAIVAVVLGMFSMEKLMTGIIAIAGILGVLVVAVGILSKLSITKAKAESMSIALGSITSAIFVMMAAVVALSFIPINKFLKGILGLGVILAALIAFTKLVNPVSLTATGLGLLLVSAAVGVLVGALLMLSTLSFTEIVIGLGALVVILTTLALFSLIVSPLTGTLIMLGAALALVGIGVLAVVAGMWLFMEVIGRIADEEFVQNFRKALENVGNAISTFLSWLFTSVLNLWKNIGTIIANALKTFANWFTTTVWPWLSKFFSNIWTGIKTLAGNMLDWLKNFFSIDNLKEVGSNIINGIIEGAVILFDKFKTAMSDFGDFVFNLFTGKETEIEVDTSEYDEAGQAASDAADKIEESNDRITDSNKELEKGNPIHLEYEVDDSAEVSTADKLNAANQVTDGVSDEIQDDSLLDDLTDFGGLSMDSFTEGLINKIPGISSSSFDIGAIVPESMSDGMSANGKSFEDSVADVTAEGMDAGIATMEDYDATFQYAGSNVITNFTDGMKELLEDEYNNDNPINILDILCQNIFGLFKYFNVSGGTTTAWGWAKDIGRYIVQGIADGIDQNTWYVEDAASDAVKAAIDAANAAGGINSPAKEFMPIGGFMVQGMAVGINNETDAVTNAMTETVTDAIKVASDLIDSDINYSPTITPVIDLNEFNKGINAATQSLDGLDAVETARSIDTSSSFIKPSQNESKTNNKTADGNTYILEQNNYSPKALSASEIYRNTRSAFANFKNKLEGAK